MTVHPGRVTDTEEGGNLTNVRRIFSCTCTSGSNKRHTGDIDINNNSSNNKSMEQHNAFAASNGNRNGTT